MAIKRTSSNSISNAVKLSTGFSSAAIPNSPTIGAATATSDVAATVAYTAAVLGATGSTFTATSNPSSITGTGSSPITVTGLTASTSYTFSVTAGNANGTSTASSASNSITTSAPLSSYESIATTTVGSGGAATVTFSSIPATYTHLQARIMTTASTLDDLGMKVNSTVGLKTHWLMGNGTTATAPVNNAWAGIGLYISNNGNETTYPNAIIVDLLDYTNTNKNKVIRFLGGIDKNGSGRVWLGSGLFDDLTAVSSITFTSSFAQYSSIALYGIKGA